MRVVYRGDFDGTVCAAMLLEIDMCDELLQVHPQDVQDGKVEITDQDILCNVPYHPDCHMWFDHHTSELNRVDFPTAYEGLTRYAPSAASLVYEYFKDDFPFLSKYENLVAEVDLYDSADITREQILHPDGARLMAFLLDPRTGLGLRHDFAISNLAWSTQIPELLTMHTMDEILEMPDSLERIRKFMLGEEESRSFYAEHSYLDGNVIVTDVRGLQTPIGNRFIVYLIPKLETGNISVRIADGKKGEFNSITLGHSLFVRTSEIDAGTLCQKFGGGGHAGAGACQVSIEDSDRVLAEIIAACKE